MQIKTTPIRMATLKRLTILNVGTNMEEPKLSLQKLWKNCIVEMQSRAAMLENSLTVFL